MATTWDDELDGDALNLRLYVKVQGVPNIFQDARDDVPTTLEASERPRTKLITKIEPGETRLNLRTRRQEGGGLTVRMQDDEDGTLRALFSPRRYRKGYVTSSATASDTTINVTSTAWDTDVWFYVGAETVTFKSSTATAFTNCTRGAYDSEAQVHLGAAENGASIFETPPSWVGRRVYLVGYALDDKGDSSSALAAELGTFRLEAAPRHLGDDVWEFQCSPLSDEFGSKKLGGGLVTVEVPDIRGYASDTTDGVGEFVVGAGDAYNQFVTGGATTHVLAISESDNGLVWPLAGQVDDADDDTIGVYYAEQLVDPPRLWDTVKSLRHIAILKDPNAGRIALQVITSRRGDGANGDYDQLPGRDPDAFGRGAWRFGAGIAETEVDVDAFLDIGGRVSDWSYVIDEEVDLADFLFEFCLHTNSMWLVDRAGRLTVRTMTDESAASVMTIDDDVLLPDSPVTIEYDEGGIYPRAHLECNYDPIERKYCAVVNIFDTEMQKRYPGREDSLELRSKSIVMAEAPRGGRGGGIVRPWMERPELETMFRRLQTANGRGRALVTLTCQMPAWKAEAGDVVTLDRIEVPDLEGEGELTNRLARVVAQRPRPDDGAIEMTVELVEALWRIAPACRIASAAGAVLTLNTTGPEVGEDPANAGEMFGALTEVQVWDVSAGTFEQHQVQASSGATVTLAAAPGFVVQAGIDFICLDVQGLTVTVNANGYEDWLYQMPDDENDGTAIEITRWR